jgi:uncharacterized protein (DUF1501 family)
MKRRQFLQNGSLMSLPVLLGGLEVSAISKSSLFSLVNNGDDKVLVLIQMNGGNDGLNMVIPLDQYSGLNLVRPNLVLPENAVLKLTDKTGLHPAMKGLQDLFTDQKMAVVQSVGYPNQNRSHFRSTDIWTSASEADEYLTTGWIGRYLDNVDCPDPLAITLASVVSETCQGPMANFGFTLTSENSVKIVEETLAAPSDGSCYSNELSFIRTTIQQSNAYATNVLNAFDKGANIAAYPENNRLANQLKVVAQLISGGLGTKIYVVNLGGFDTHSNQVLIGDPENGEHATLLQTLSDAIAAFMKDCKALSIEERVMGMTFSEFGRQIRSNNSYGTDHGTAAPLILFGNCVKYGVVGANPEITDQVAPQEGVPMLYDFRSVYASLLIDWLGASENEVKSILFDDFQKLNLVKDCAAPSSSEDYKTEIEASLTPNPCSRHSFLQWEHNTAYVHLSVLNALGAQMDVLINKTIQSGKQEVWIDMSQYSAGSYFVRLAIGNRVKTMKLIKV